MKPPICNVCDKDFGPEEGGLVYFAKRPSDIEWEKRMRRIQGQGHPPWAAWFCGDHYDRARELSHLTIGEAMKILKK